MQVSGCFYLVCLYWVSILCLNSKKCAWRGSTVVLKERCRDSGRPSITQGSEVYNMNPNGMEWAESRQESLKDKYMLTVKEAVFYFNIGTEKMRRIAEDNLGNIAVYSGNRFLIIRPKFEDFIRNSSEI